MPPEHTDAHLENLLFDIKKSMDTLNADSESKSELYTQTSKTLVKVQECLGSIKIELTELKSEQKGFISARKDRTLNCDKVHADFEQRLREQPPSLRCIGNEARLQSVEKKVDGFTPLIYKLIGGVTVMALVIPPLASALFAFIIKHLIKG